MVNRIITLKTAKRDGIKSLRANPSKSDTQILVSIKSKASVFKVKRTVRFIPRTLPGIQLSRHCHTIVVLSEITLWQLRVYCSSEDPVPEEHKTISQTSEVKQM